MQPKFFGGGSKIIEFAQAFLSCLLGQLTLNDASGWLLIKF